MNLFIIQGSMNRDRKMDHQEAALLAERLIKQHQLHGWTLQWDRAKRRLGLCDYRNKIISLSYDYVKLNNSEEVKDTILHEIAHALAGAKTGHGEKWKLICMQIGAKPERCCNDPVVMPKGDWRAICKSCNYLYHFFRKPKKSSYYCRKCGTIRGKLVFQYAPEQLDTNSIKESSQNDLNQIQQEIIKHFSWIPPTLNSPSIAPGPFPPNPTNNPDNNRSSYGKKKRVNQSVWTAICPCCKMAHQKQRKPRSNATYYCKKCGPTRGILTFKQIFTIE